MILVCILLLRLPACGMACSLTPSDEVCSSDEMVLPMPLIAGLLPFILFLPFPCNWTGHHTVPWL